MFKHTMNQADALINKTLGLNVQFGPSVYTHVECNQVTVGNTFYHVVDFYNAKDNAIVRHKILPYHNGYQHLYTEMCYLAYGDENYSMIHVNDDFIAYAISYLMCV